MTSPMRCHELGPHTPTTTSHSQHQQQEPCRSHTPFGSHARPSTANSAHGDRHGRVGPSLDRCPLPELPLCGSLIGPPTPRQIPWTRDPS